MKGHNYYEPLKQVARRRVRSVLKIHVNDKTPIKSTSPSPSLYNGEHRAFMIPTMKTEYENYSTRGLVTIDPDNGGDGYQDEAGKGTSYQNRPTKPSIMV